LIPFYKYVTMVTLLARTKKYLLLRLFWKQRPIIRYFRNR